jgi:hypothetical protein
MSTTNSFHLGARHGLKSIMVAVLMGAALSAGVATATADVVPGTEDGWGTPPGGVTLSVVGDDGSGNHLLSVTWGAIDPIPSDGGYWQCGVQEYFTPKSVSKAFFDVKLLPPSGGSYQQKVANADPGERISLSIRCYTVHPGAFGVTPPSPEFGWKFDYQLS